MLFSVAFYRDSLVLTLVQLIETIVLKKIFESEKPIPYLITLVSVGLNYNIIKQILLIHDDTVSSSIKAFNVKNIQYLT